MNTSDHLEQSASQSLESSLPSRDTGAPEPVLLNRELTWLAFNQRVLAEAERTENPLLERLKFLAIVNANLDEFFMKRIGGLKQQVGAGISTLSADGRTAQEQINACYEIINEIDGDINRIFSELLTQLRDEDIHIADFKDLAARQKERLCEHFYDNIYPLLTPQSIDPAHPFPFVSNLSLNLLITLAYPDQTIKRHVLSRLKVPVGQGSPRFIRVENDEGVDLFVTLEDLIINNMDIIFPQMQIVAVEIFRVTRNAVTEQDEERAEDLLELIESELRERRFAPIVRMQFNTGMDSVHKGMLSAELHLDENKDVFEVDGLMAKRDLMELMSVKRADLKLETHHPLDHGKLVGEDNIFHAIRNKGPFLIQQPYESFSSSVERFVRDASRDPKVIGIKMTIYRTSSDSKIIEYLIDASRNGKQVTVVVEVKARFDESANIRWANHLEEAGIHVTYGIVGLKTHAKLIYVLRQDYNGLRRYAHIGTGNYHSGTARLYGDFGLLTADTETGKDLTELFNYLTTGYTPKRNYHKLLPAPRHMKKGLLDKIHREIRHAKAGKKALIQLKTNALEDVDISLALYEASQAGVTVDLIVRDTCRIVPRVAGLSENIRVVSIVGRFLEHARVYYFANDGSEEYYIGSADLMQRNLESRVEVIVPIEVEDIQEKLRRFIDLQLHDTHNAWEMNNDGTYSRCISHSDDSSVIGSQQQCIIDAHDRYKAANRLKLRKTRFLK